MQKFPAPKCTLVRIVVSTFAEEIDRVLPDAVGALPTPTPTPLAPVVCGI